MPPLFCLRCGAIWRGTDTECWNCHRTAIPTESKEEFADWVKENFNTAVVLKVSVFLSGKLLIDGAETSLAELDVRLGQTKAQNGVVWYYREILEDQPPALAIEVLKLILNHRLPVRLSTNPDFSEAGLEDVLSMPGN